MQFIFKSVFLLLFTISSLTAQFLTVEDDFEGSGTIANWFGDDCNINTSLANPFQQGQNLSSKVMEYHDVGGQYANVRFQLDNTFNLSSKSTFSLKIYLNPEGLTGSQTNQVSLKLQNGDLGEPWSTQSEIIKSVSVGQWQTVTFDFANDNYINIDPNLPPPSERSDFNRVLIQINGEDNNDEVLAYIDDVMYDGIIALDPPDPVYDNLVWSDEFDVDGAIDGEKWFHQTELPQNGSWFNGEIQHYTDRIENSSVENGILKLSANKETFTDQGHTKQYTSARLNSKFAFTYGRVEVRAKLPQGVGTWPAIWTLGKNIQEDGGYWSNEGFGTASWPACGEIDIMEHWGNSQNFVQSATHTPSSFGGTVNKGGQVIPTASSEFHDYVLIWTPEKLIFSVDDVVHYTYEPSDKNAETWPFNADQYILLNVAILPEISASFTSDAMEIDYVRVYQESPVSNFEVNPNVVAEVYPVPFDDNLTIRLKDAQNQNTLLKIYANDGKLMGTSSQEVVDNQIIINDLSYLNKGVYFINFELGGQPYAVKVVKD